VSERMQGAAYGLLAAVLFGASAPLAKLLLPSAAPLMLAGLLYLGSGLALSIYRLLFQSKFDSGRHAPVRPADVPLLGGIVVTGGVVGPVLMLMGLQRVSAVTGSLLLNLEAVFTMLIAMVLFGEHLGALEAGATVLIVAGAAMLGFQPDELRADWLGMAAIAGACLSWGIDNNLTQRLSLQDPTAIARIKTLGAGSCTFVLALATGQRLPSPGYLFAALAVGSLSFGLSIVLDVYALRYLGAAREAAFFAVAPFAGALLAIPLLGQLPSRLDYAASALMTLGVVLLSSADHGHRHKHEALLHEHEHIHDEHHRHEHQGAVTEPHSHAHRHEPLEHEHPHVSDLHHRHRH
jgi:drug/metabolite transporter (DMT)-like permease